MGTFWGIGRDRGLSYGQCSITKLLAVYAGSRQHSINSHGTDSGEVIILKAKNYAIKQFDVFVRSSRLLYCREVRGRVIKSVKKIVS